MGYATAGSSITLDNTTVTVPQATLKAPGDKVEYIFKVVNEGDVTGYINVLNNIGIGTITYDANETMTSAQKTAFQNDIQVTLTYNDQNKTALAYNDTLAKDDEAELILTIQYINRDSEQVLPTGDVTFTGISASITYGQSTTSLSGNGSSPSNPEVVQPSAKPTMAEMCPGCVFAKYNTSHYIQSTGSTPNTLESNEYTSDYTTLNSSYFLGHILSNGYIQRSFACGIENGEAFCLEGYDASKYSNNVDILNAFFPSCNATTSNTSNTCDGSSLYIAYASSNGSVGVRGTSSTYCYAGNIGDSSCY